MPGASLTPLGRQLRAVVVNLGPATWPARTLRAACESRNRSSVDDSIHVRAAANPRSRTSYGSYHASHHTKSAAAAVAVAEIQETEEADAVKLRYIHRPTHPPKLHAKARSITHQSDPKSHVGRGNPPRNVQTQTGYFTPGLKPQARVDSVTEALKDTGQSDVVAAKVNPQHEPVRPRSRGFDGAGRGSGFPENSTNDPEPDLIERSGSKLEKILTSCIRHRAAARHIPSEEIGESATVSAFELQQQDASYLKARGYNINDVEAWADIISSPDSMQAAQNLSKHINTNGPQSVPLSVLTYLLRRSHINARALRVITRQTCIILDYLTSTVSNSRVSEDSIFLVFHRLVRHAREVWPRALSSLPEILLHYISRIGQVGSGRNPVPPAVLTSILNKAMRLIAMPTAVNPFRDNHFQEAGIVKILRFMSEHDPPLQTNREGYRAVILLQLAQRKRPEEQLWAELKTLSWPPWKVDRTAMDATDITFDNQGMSSAAVTLRQMQEAGYTPHEWERAASIYTGWDTDRTPTIQSLVLLGTGGERFRTGSAEWVARITATRTAQEAWACYLAYEAKNLHAGHDVYLAVFKKLHREEERIRKAQQKNGKRASQLQREVFPGDTQEVEPLPPSIHLYTYTRTPPPTVEGFYRQLRDRGIEFRGWCLAFLLENATSLKRGIDYLLESALDSDHKRQLLEAEPSFDSSQIPMTVFTAYIKLLCRFSNVPFPDTVLPHCDHPSALKARELVSEDSQHSRTGERYSRMQLPLLGFIGKGVNTSHTLVKALNLVVQRRPLFRPAWNAMLQSLAKEMTLRNISSIMTTHVQRQYLYAHLTQEHRQQQGAIMAHRLMRKVLSAVKSLHLDLDVAGFQALCQGVENVAVGSWLTLLRCKRDAAAAEDGLGLRFTPEPSVKQAMDAMDVKPTERLKAEFRILVGYEDEPSEDSTLEQEPTALQTPQVKLPQLLEMPSPAVLHAYIRALGWLADYDAIMETLRWMVYYKDELAQRVDRDRRGEVMMRKCVVALRVFLERAWLPDTTSSEPEEVSSSVPVQQVFKEKEAASWRRALSVMVGMLESPAPDDVIEEARRLVESVEILGSWPDDESVLEYFVEFAARPDPTLLEAAFLLM